MPTKKIKPKFRLHSVRARIFIATLITVLPIVVGISYYIWEQYDSLAKESFNDAIDIVSNTAAYDKNLLDQASEVLTNVSYMPILRQESWPRCSKYLKSLYGGNTDKYLNLGVLDLKGRLVCSGREQEDNMGAFLGERPYYKEALRNLGMVFSGYLPPRIAKQPTIMLAVRIPSYHGNTVGIAYLTVNLNYLHVDSKWSKLQPESKIWVLDKNMVVLHSMPDGINQPGDTLDIKHKWSEEIHTNTYTDASGRDWYSLLVATQPPNYKNTLYVRYDVPKSVIYANANRYLWFGIGSLIVLLLLTAMSAWVLMQLAAGKSLDQLRKAVVGLANGDLDTRVGNQLQGKELQEIGRQFDVMADKIQTSESSLRQSEYGYRMLFDNGPNPMLVLDLDSGKVLAANNEALRIYGYSKEELLNLNFSDLRKEVLYDQPDSVYSNELHKRKDDKPLFVQVRSLSLLFTGRSAHVLLIKDMTEREFLNRDLKERESLISHLLDVTTEAIYGLDAAGCCIFANKACAKLLGFDHPHELIGQHFHSLVHYKHADGSPYQLEDCVLHINLKKGEGAHVDNEVLWRRDGTSFPVEYWSYPIYKQGELDFCLVTFIDITERKSQQETLAYQAKHDNLTGLYNRSELNRKLHKQISMHPDKTVTLAIGNLDNFKEINEALGHDMGDLMLQCVADRLSRELPSNSWLSRIGGDEFAFILSDINLLQAYSTVEALMQVVKEPFVLEGLKLRTSMSFGISQYPLHADSALDLIRKSDTTMHKAKKESLGLTIYNFSYSEKSHERLLLRGELITAIEQRQFIIHLQPKLALRSKNYDKGDVIGFEALVRWNHPLKGIIPPNVFIPIIEASDLIHDFTYIVLNKSVSYCAELQKKYPGMRISVNVSVKNLLEKSFANQIKNVLEKYGLDASLLEIEVTESALMVDPERSLATLKAVFDLGVLLSIDDFGTGYSSFSYLNKLPIDVLKIDQTFVFGIDEDKSKATIVKSIIDMAHTLGMRVIAEGIESKAVLNTLYAMGCDAGQGYYIGRPTNIKEIYQWLENKPDFFE